MTERTAELLQGTLDLLILKTLSLGPEHGWGVAQRIQQMSRSVLQVNQGSLYPALHRLERGGLLTSRWSRATGRRRRVYRLTRKGSEVLADRAHAWREFSAGVDLVLREA